MSTLLFSNNATTTIAGSISNTATTVNLASGAGALFPSPGANQYFVGTLTDAATGLVNEIVWVTARSGDTLTIVRGQEGTTAQPWSANDLFGNLWTAGQASTMVQQVELQAQATNYALDTGSANAYLCALTPAITSPVNGMPIRLKVANTNTGASTFNPGSGAASIRRADGSTLIGNELVAGNIVTLIYDGTYYRIAAAAPATTAAITAGTDTQSFVTPSQLASYSPIPAGAMMPFAGPLAPTGWLLCAGQSVSTTAYAALFAVIGYTYGGTGTVFSIPDLRGRVVAGMDGMGGTAAGRLTNTTVTPNGITLGAVGGSQTNTASTTSSGTTSGSLSVLTNSYSMDGPNAGFTVIGGGGGAYTLPTMTHIHANVLSSGSATGTLSVGVSGISSAFSVVQPTLVANYIIKT